MLVTASEYAEIHGKSKQWVCELIKLGRLTAERQGKVLMVDSDTPMPVSLILARRTARMARVDAERAKHGKPAIEQAPPINPPDMAAWIEHQLDHGWVFDESGRSHVPGVRPWRAAPVGWTADHWTLARSL